MSEMQPDVALADTGHRPESAAGRLQRTTFSTSRLLDFCSRKELIAQTGHEPAEWPIVVLKELVDNALDACEEHDIAPQIAVRVDADGIAIADNGPGLPAATIDGVLVAERLLKGREQYGALDPATDPRDFRTEAFEEVADACVYLAADCVRRGRQ